MTDLGVLEAEPVRGEGKRAALDSGLLIAFGDMSLPDGRAVSAGTIFRDLMSRGYWLSPRVPTGTFLDSHALFYQSGSGFRSVARITSIQSTTAAEGNIWGSHVASFFRWTIKLVDIEVFEEPLDIRPLIERLGFVVNKRYWGHSLRNTPRRISREDLSLILKQGAPRGTGRRA